MSNPSEPATPDRDARLAAKLRENLQRRKQQVRAQHTVVQHTDAPPPLPKAPPKS